MSVPSAPIRNRNNVNTNSQRSVFGLGESESEVQQWQVNGTQSNSNVDWEVPPSQEYNISGDRERYPGANYEDTQVRNEERCDIASSRPSAEGSFHQLSAAKGYQRCDRPNRSFEDQRVRFDRSQDRLFRYNSADETEPAYYRGESQVFPRGQNNYRLGGSRSQSSSECYGLKIPPFNGKEDWKVWINRFEAIAERRHWNEETKLDNLLPQLQGKAGDFVFTQVTKQTLSNYSELVKELNSRFRVVETEKTFAAKFSQRRQRADEKVEEYAADLKCLYARAYRNRDTEAQVPDHLTDMYTRASTDLNPHEKMQLASLLNRFGDSFSCGEWDLGLTNLAEHAIETEDAAPIKHHPRRVPLAHAEAEKQAIEDLKAKGVIRESTSPWASPIVLVAKKDGGVRPCVDYRRVNQLVKPDGFPLPRIQDCLDAVAGSSLFSTMDLTSGYFQIPVKREDIPKTAFVCKYGHFEMTRMPFGLNNAASTFQRTMELALQGLQWVTCLIYIDDVIVFGKDFDEHMQRLEEVLDRIKKAGLKLKASKSYLLQKEVIFLGHVVSGEGIKPSPTNVTKVVDWPTPKTAKQVKQFVAMASYYRRYVRNFASTARPMVDLTKKGKKFLWSEACENAFNSLKRALISADVMGYPLNEAGEFILDVDASDLGIGAVLHQVQGGKETVLAYASRSLNKAEANYCITEKELLAARYFIEYFRQYLLGKRFLVRSDHQSLVWLFQLKEPRGKIARWIEILSQYDFAIQYRPGKKQPHCDALSRCENPRACDCPQQDTMEPLKCGPCRKCVKWAQDMVHEKLYKDLTTHESALQQDTQTAKGVDELPEAVPGPSSKPDSSDCTQPDPHLITSWFQGKSTAELRKLQENDSDIGPILRAFASERRPTSQEMSVMSPASRHYWIIWDALILQDGLLCKKFIKKDGTGEYIQFIVPTAMKKEVLHQMHDSVLSGHLGCKKTKAKIIQRFYWYSLRDDIKLHIQKCDVCAADKKPTKVPKAPLGHLNAGAPGDCVATDYLGPLPVTGRGNRYILLLTDHFTKYVEIIPVPDMTAEICAQKIHYQFTVTREEPTKAKSLSSFAECSKSGKLEQAQDIPREMANQSVSTGLF